MQSAFYEVAIPRAHKGSTSRRVQELNMMEMYKRFRDTQGQWLAASELHKLENGDDWGKQGKK